MYSIDLRAENTYPEELALIGINWVTQRNGKSYER
jgi:hypothetical protein